MNLSEALNMTSAVEDETEVIVATPRQHYVMAEKLIHEYHHNANMRFTSTLMQAQIHATLATVNLDLPMNDDNDEDLRP